MTLRFTVLASGSSGNASALEAAGCGLLIDAGLGPRSLAQRFDAAGLAWERIQCVLLTHTHSDHWKEQSLAHLLRRRIPLYCHADHRRALAESSPAFLALVAGSLVQSYESLTVFEPTPGLQIRPLPLSHDSGATFGFRCEVAATGAALAFAADLGTWTAELLEHMADVDLLALEFNHDVAMEKNSGRAPHLIDRVLGDRGHLSNAQAAALLEEILARTEPGRLQHLVQLHLSRHCNRTALAQAAAQAALRKGGHSVTIHTAQQAEAGPSLEIDRLRIRPHRRPGARQRRPATARAMATAQPHFPGWEAG